jgi:Tol biopolymer transport system component
MKVGQALGHYHVVRTLGRGGMGAVYEANDTRLNRQVALKVLPAKMANDPEWFKRFEREAQAVAALNHPNIVTIHSVESADDVHFIILELVGGKTLDALIPDDGLPLKQFFDVAIPLTDAIAAAHRRGIVHRDLKPGNVMVDGDGRVKVLDFGIAKLFADDVGDDEAATQVGSEALTEEGKIVGTVAYMSPEQAEGKASDHRSDIFSLGILMYEMATGHRPFVGDTKLSILASIVKDEPSPIYERNLDLPRHLARIVKKALEKDVNRRYQSVVELHNDLVELKEEIDAGLPLVTGEALTDPGALSAYRRPPAARPAPLGMWLGIGGLLVGAAALTWALWSSGSEPTVSDAPPGVTLTQLTTSPALDFGGTISDDGDWFAFTRQSNGEHTIHLQAVGSRNAIPIAAGGASPAFSADGEHIAFSEPPQLTSNTAMGGGISIMGRTGDDSRRLTPSGYNPAWSPDGTRIVYADEFVSSRPYSRLNDSKLHIVTVDTGEIVSLDSLRDAVQPAWSPNGHRVAYWAILNGQRDLWTVRPDGSDERRLTDDVHVDYSPVWSPDGSWVYYASTRGGSMAIWRMAVDEESGDPRGDPQQITSGGLGDPGMLSFSADGAHLLYTVTLTRGSVVAADFDAGRLAISGEPEPVVEGTRRLVQPDVSPDGSRIAYRTEGARQDIFVVRTDGTDERQVTDDDAKDWAPRWSPDGERLAFYSNASGDYELWLASPDGTDRRRLTNSPDEAPQIPVWSPDGDRIATFLSDSDNDAFIFEPGPEPVALLELPPLPRVDAGTGQFQPHAWHPDGNLLVGSVDPAAGADAAPTVWLHDLSAGTYELLAEGSQPRFMGDGRRVLHRTPDQQAFRVIDIVTRESFDVAVPERLGLIESIVLSPANDRAYLVRVDQESDIWVLELR